MSHIPSIHTRAAFDADFIADVKALLAASPVSSASFFPPSFKQSAAASIATADKSHLEPVLMSAHYSRVHHCVKNWYLSQGHTLNDWAFITSSPKLFNSCWNQALGLPPSQSPPPLSLRYKFTSSNSN